MGSVSYYRAAEGRTFKVLTGQVKLSGAILANPAWQPAAAAGVYQRIVAAQAPVLATSAGLSPAWWRGYATGFTSRMITSTQPVPWAA